MEADASVSVYTLVNNEDIEQEDANMNKNIYFTINDEISQENLTESTDSYIIQDDEIVYQLDTTSLLNTNLKIVTLNNEKFLCIATDEAESDKSEESRVVNQNLIQFKQRFSDETQELVHNIGTEDTQIESNGNTESYQMIMYDDLTQSNIVVNRGKKIKYVYKNNSKSYSNSQHLSVHNNINIKPYSCTFQGCEKNFSTNYSLKAHVRTHTGEKPYSCQVCFKSFKTSGDLQKHIRTHTGEKPFICPFVGCGKSFTTSNIRKVHIRSHTGERPYVCDYPNCGKSFASSTNYKNHSRIHSGEKPYACTVKDCGKRFTEYSSYYKHQVVHKVDKPHKCNCCKQCFKSEHALNIHKKVKHGILSTESVHIEMNFGV
ncbi:uncharacterized protein LOC143205140 isoform X1 [Rhynchophorus ferrugineus]|uniref:uncharacterized protein LOC143205140 isoform X1 n=1 Tax=Rhynchophorus ferrugineus TaxID=354439 RepID=UPI003FCC4B9B